MACAFQPAQARRPQQTGQQLLLLVLLQEDEEVFQRGEAPEDAHLLERAAQPQAGHRWGAARVTSRARKSTRP